MRKREFSVDNLTDYIFMRVLILNTSEKTGGAAVAANRLMDALNNNGVKAKMLVRDKETDRITVVGLKQSLMRQWGFLWDGNLWVETASGICIYPRITFLRLILLTVERTLPE